MTHLFQLYQQLSLREKLLCNTALYVVLLFVYVQLISAPLSNTLGNVNKQISEISDHLAGLGTASSTEILAGYSERPESSAVTSQASLAKRLNKIIDAKEIRSSASELMQPLLLGNKGVTVERFTVQPGIRIAGTERQLWLNLSERHQPIFQYTVDLTLKGEHAELLAVLESATNKQYVRLHSFGVSGEASGLKTLHIMLSVLSHSDNFFTASQHVSDTQSAVVSEGLSHG